VYHTPFLVPKGLLEFNPAAGNQASDSRSLTPPLPLQWGGEEKMDKKGNLWVETKTV